MLPYVVKGMDVSFSGILSHLEEQVGSTFMEQGVCIFNVNSNLLCCQSLVRILVIILYIFITYYNALASERSVGWE